VAAAAVAEGALDGAEGPHEPKVSAGCSSGSSDSGDSLSSEDLSGFHLSDDDSDEEEIDWTGLLTPRGRPKLSGRDVAELWTSTKGFMLSAIFTYSPIYASWVLGLRGKHCSLYH
jgi:hypothetical protein